MKGLQEAAHWLVCLAWQLLALAQPLSFPDIPWLSWPQERRQRGRAPALCVACGGWQEGPDHEAGGSVALGLPPPDHTAFGFTVERGFI